MIYVPLSYDDLALNDGLNYSSVMTPGQGLPPSQARFSVRHGRRPIVSDVVLLEQQLIVGIAIEGSDVKALRTQLFQKFKRDVRRPKVLVVTDQDGSNPRYLTAVCEELTQVADGGGLFWIATLKVANDVCFRKTTVTSQTWNITATGQTVTVTNNGEDDAFPVFRFEPTSVKTTGYAYKRWFPVRWLSDLGYVDYPYDVANAGLSTAALVADTSRSVQINQGGGINSSVTTIPYDTAVGVLPNSGLAYVDSEQISYTGKNPTQLTGVTRGVNGTTAASHADNAVIRASKLQADGDDLRLQVNGAEADRWLSGINTANTKVWGLLTFAGKQEVTLETALSGAGTIDTIDVNEDISGFPDEGILMIGSEAFVYTDKSNALRRFTGVTRESRGTSAASHSAGVTVWWVQNDVFVLYGNPSVSAPVTDDSKKPIFNLSTSTNTSWDYDEFGETSVTEIEFPRAGRWSKQKKGLPTFYTANNGTNANPWQEMGIYIYTNKGDVTTGLWVLYNPCGIVSANFQNGQKKTTITAGKWDARIQSSITGESWTTEFVITVPGLLDTWAAWSQNETLQSNARYVALAFLNTQDNADRHLEVADVTVALDSTYTPTTSVGSEQSNYDLACTLTNTTRGEAVELTFNMALNEGLEFDTDNFTVKYLLDNSSQFQGLEVIGSPRAEYLPLSPGDNVLQFDDAGTTGLTITIEYEERFIS